MIHTVFLNDNLTWLDTISYREWLRENVGIDVGRYRDWEMGTLPGDAPRYFVNFQNAEDATAFKLKFSI